MSTTPPSTPTSFLSELMHQKGLLIGLGLAIVGFFVFSRRPAPQEKAARRLVRDFRHVDDAGDLRDVLGSTLPTIVRPVLLLALEEIERQVHRGFDNLERELERL
jgi:hypothetical protein